MLLPASRALATVKAREPCKITAVDAGCRPENGVGIRARPRQSPEPGQERGTMITTQGRSCDILTSIQASSFMSPESSLDLLLPLTACRLLGGAQSSTALDAGLFLSSILTKAAGWGGADVNAESGIRKGAARGQARQ